MLVRFILAVLAPVAALTTLASGQVKYAEFEYSAGDSGDYFGRGLALDGEVALIGAPSPSWFTGPEMGFVVVVDPRTGEELEVLMPSDSSAEDEFGYSVAMSADYILVGAPGAGAAYVFDRTTYQELYKIERAATFGFDVSVSGTIAIVGEHCDPFATVSHAGRARIFDLDTGQELHLLEPPASENDSRFGRSVGIQGGHAVVGSRGPQNTNNGTYPGFAHVYDVGSGQRLYRLSETGPSAGVGVELGMSVAIRGNRVVVGAPREAIPFQGNVGAVYIYETLTGQSLGKLTPVTADQGFGSLFGSDVSMSNGRVFVADIGSLTTSVALFDVESGSQLMRLTPDDLGSEGDAGFAASVVLSGDQALVSDLDISGLSVGRVHALLLDDMLGTTYCSPAALNSSGLSGRLQVYGSVTAFDNSIVLSADRLPFDQFGYFVGGPNQGFVANPGGSQGNLCLGAGIGRYVDDVFFTGESGLHSLFIDLKETPSAGGIDPIVAGETWNWSAWFRDANPGSTSNFTDAVSITFQ